MIISLSIPIKTHLKKYFLEKHKTVEPVIISKKSVFGKFIIHGFSRQNNKPKSCKEFKQTLSVKFDHEQDLTFSEGNVYDFNDILEDIYRKDLATFVGMDKLFNPEHEKKRAVEQFNRKFRISEDDISLETILKHLQRHTEDTKLFDYELFKKVS